MIEPTRRPGSAVDRFAVLMAVLTVGFLVLRVTGVTAWSWWWVFAPVWAPLVAFLVCAAICLLATDFE